MDAVEFLKEAKRYCRWCKNTTQDGKKRLCEVCYFEKLNDTFDLHPMAYYKFVEMVEQWAKEHPVKTRQSEFLKIFPNAELNEDGVLLIAPCDIYQKEKINGCYDNGCSQCFRNFWLKEIK